MKSSSTKQDVVDFLRDWTIAARRFVDFVPREKNVQGLIGLGLTVWQARKILQNLKVSNYVAGPKADKEHDGELLWVFGAEENGKEIYIKIKLFEYAGEKMAKCISFHPAECPLKYPLSKGGIL